MSAIREIGRIVEFPDETGGRDFARELSVWMNLEAVTLVEVRRPDGAVAGAVRRPFLHRLTGGEVYEQLFHCPPARVHDPRDD